VKYFKADRSVEDGGWWVPLEFERLGTTIKLKVFVEGHHKSLKEVHEEFYEVILPALGVVAEEELA